MKTEKKIDPQFETQMNADLEDLVKILEELPIKNKWIRKALLSIGVAMAKSAYMKGYTKSMEDTVARISDLKPNIVIRNSVETH